MHKDFIRGHTYKINGVGARRGRESGEAMGEGRSDPR